MKKVIIVTSGAGFVGSNLIKYLLIKTKCNIYSIDNYSSGTKKNHIVSKRVKYINGNTININKILSKQKKNIITIFHFGEFSRIFQSFKKFHQCYDSNSIGTKEVFKFCLDNKIKLIYSATSASLGQSRRFTHIDDTIKICYKAWKANKCRHYSISHKKNYTIKEVADMFKTRIKYLPPRPGERFASSLTNMSLNNRVIKKYGKISLKNYVYSIIKNRI